MVTGEIFVRLNVGADGTVLLGIQREKPRIKVKKNQDGSVDSVSVCCREPLPLSSRAVIRKCMFLEGRKGRGTKRETICGGTLLELCDGSLAKGACAPERGKNNRKEGIRVVLVRHKMRDGNSGGKMQMLVGEYCHPASWKSPEIQNMYPKIPPVSQDNSRSRRM